MKSTRKTILLVNPAIDSDMEAFREFFKPMLSIWEKRAYMVPLPLATLAALTPDHIEVDIWDEDVHGRIDENTDLKDYDLVGVTGLVAQTGGAKRVARIFKKRGIPVLGGGPGVSHAPEYYRDDFDVLFIGEAEYAWRTFLSDWEEGTYRKEYRQIAKPDMDDFPLPRWDSLVDDLKYYLTGGVQTTRGCSFDCEFCQVSFLHGHRIRTKPIDCVIEEICALERLGVKQIVFCDDNFIANPRYTKELLRELIPVNNSFSTPLAYHTELSLNLAKDEELLELFADVNFGTVCIGLETPNKEALKETNKPQNYTTNIVEDVHRILSYGIGVRGGLIVGFDHDDVSIFDRQFEFIQETCIHGPVINMVKAMPGTRLWSRLHKERRLIDEERLILTNEAEQCKFTPEYLFAHTNIIPKRMTRVELMTGYKHLMERVHDWKSFAERVKGFVSLIKRPPLVTRKTASEDVVQRVLKVIEQEDEKAQNAIFSILLFTHEHVPSLLRTVMRFVLYQLGTARVSEAVCMALDQQIRREVSIPTLEPYIDKRPVLLPDRFVEEYRRVFPEIYQQVLDGLVDKHLLPEALVEVFKDLRMHWGDGFEGMEVRHRVDVQEIADQAIAAKNQMQGQGGTHLDEVVFDSRTMNQLKMEVLKFVERDVHEFYYSPSSDDSSAERRTALVY